MKTFCAETKLSLANFQQHYLSDCALQFEIELTYAHFAQFIISSRQSDLERLALHTNQMSSGSIRLHDSTVRCLIVQAFPPGAPWIMRCYDNGGWKPSSVLAKGKTITEMHSS